MKRLFANAALVGLGLAGLFGFVGAARGQAQQDIYSPVILGREVFTPGRPIQIREDGSGLQAISIDGDLTYNGVKGQRYFLRAEPVTGVTLPDGSQYYDLVTYNENGDLTTRRVLTSDTSTTRFYRSFPRWSINGKRVTYYGKQYDLLNGDPNKNYLFKYGVCVGEITFDANAAPSALTDERCLVQPDVVYPVLPSWASDNLRVTYSTTRFITNPDGSSFRQDSIYVAYLPPSGSLDSPYNRKILFADGDRPIQIYPKFSPVVYDDRLAFSRYRDGQHNDIWIVVVPFNYDGTYALTANQVTNQKTIQQVNYLGHVEWSPSSTYIAFDGQSSSSGTMQIYKIDAAGTERAIQLTSSKNQAYIVSGWRK